MPWCDVVKSTLWTLSRVSRNTAPCAPRTPRAPHWNIVKISRRWCLGFNWISSKISRKRWVGEGEELTKGRNVQLLAVQVYSQCGARGVRGAVFRDIASATAVWGGSKNLNPRNPPNTVSINKIHPLQRNEIHFYEAKTNYRNSFHWLISGVTAPP